MTASKPTPDAFDLTRLTWQKSSYTGGTGDCVELAVAGTYILLRDSNTPNKAPHVFTRPEITAFLAGVKDGEFDHMINN